MTDAVVNVANVLYCAAHTNLTMTEANVVRLVFELTGRLNSLVKELSTAVSTLDFCARQFVHLPGLKGDHFSPPPAELQRGGVRHSADFYRGGASDVAPGTPKRPQFHRALV